MTTFKSSTTWRPYIGNCNGVTFRIPAGSKVNNGTVCGPNDNLFYWAYSDWSKRFPPELYPHTAYDLANYGLLIPHNYCKPYRKEKE